MDPEAIFNKASGAVTTPVEVLLFAAVCVLGWLLYICWTRLYTLAIKQTESLERNTAALNGLKECIDDLSRRRY